MKKSLLILLFFPFCLFSQEQRSYKYTDLNADPPASSTRAPASSPGIIARISFLEPMFVLEFAPVESFVFSSRVRIWPTFWEKDVKGQWYYSPSLNPGITLEPRYFFTQEYRRSRGKRRDYYSGWYLGLPFTMSLPDLDYSMASIVGFQCTFGKRWYWNAGMGPGAAYYDNAWKYAWPVNAAFGIILN